MIQRRHSNRIYKLKDIQGSVLIKHQDIQEELVNYFQDLLTKSIQNRQVATNKITRNIPKLINEDQNIALMRPIIMHEVETTIKQTLEGKSPSLDGFTT